MPALGFDWHETFVVEDEITGESWRWGETQLRAARPVLRARARPADPEGPDLMSCDDPMWFKRAVFYEVLVRSFKDSNGDGVGDFSGVREKLDYLAWLGVDCLWIPPFFASPLRDGGYDVADYDNILPEVGTRRRLQATRSTTPTHGHQGHHRLRDEPHQ